MAQGHVQKSWNAQFRGRENVEFFLIRVEMTVRSVGKDQDRRVLGVPFPYRSKKRSHLSQAMLGGNGKDCYIIHVCVSCLLS